jgi:hypothetical protein
LERDAILQQHVIALMPRPREEDLSEAFRSSRIVGLANVLTPSCLLALRAEADRNRSRMVRSYIPTHKKGSTLSYEDIHRYAPYCLAFYHSPQVQDLIASIVSGTLYTTPEQDQSSLSLLCYEEAGDHIHWHYDHNFYRGRHFTVLLSLRNESTTGSLSASRLQYRDRAGRDVELATGANTLVVFEGARVWHRATPAEPGDLRILLSMTYCCDPRNNYFQEFCRRVKDTAFFGIRAIWR